MKARHFSKRFLTMTMMALLIAGCSVHTSPGNSGKLPPGQAKKKSGSKSAKAYAPGQQKKK